METMLFFFIIKEKCTKSIEINLLLCQISYSQKKKNVNKILSNLVVCVT